MSDLGGKAVCTVRFALTIFVQWFGWRIVSLARVQDTTFGICVERTQLEHMFACRVLGSYGPTADLKLRIFGHIHPLKDRSAQRSA